VSRIRLDYATFTHGRKKLKERSHHLFERLRASNH
jgi:hypothetical protein